VLHYKIDNMKKIFPLLFMGLIVLDVFSQTGSVGIGTTNPNSSAALEIQSSTKGVLIPRMTTVQRNAIASPANGLLVYDNTTNSFWFKSATNWIELSDSANNVWKKNGTNAYVNVPDNVGIGTTTPQYNLDINKPNATIGFTDAQTNQFSGSISGNSNTLNINATRTLLGQDPPGNLLLQTNAFLAAAGNVGIGNSNPTNKLDVIGNTRLQGNLNVSNGNVGIGVTNPVEKLEVAGSMVVSNFIRRPPTGLANLVPICYGSVNSNGFVLGGTGNFSASEIVIFNAFSGYHIVINNVIVNLNTDVVIITPFDPVDGANITTSVSDYGSGFAVTFRHAGSGTPGIIARSNFSFMVFRP